jgi:hypothetical protein
VTVLDRVRRPVEEDEPATEPSESPA